MVFCCETKIEITIAQQDWLPPLLPAEAKLRQASITASKAALSSLRSALAKPFHR
jgi:hypothetical protein